jgi:hypothetical protein
MFDASVTVEVGNGWRALFSRDRWIDGCSLPQLAPGLIAAVSKRTRACRVVADALHNDRWIANIGGSLSITALSQYVSVWTRMQNIQLDQGPDDKFVWKWISNQQYLASSDYKVFFLGQSSIPGAKELCKITTPPRCKFFIWLAQDRCWTSERLQRHQLQNNSPCVFFSQAYEPIDHLMIPCVYALSASRTWCRRGRQPSWTGGCRQGNTFTNPSANSSTRCSHLVSMVGAQEGLH